jgi:hypothetical protein
VFLLINIWIFILLTIISCSCLLKMSRIIGTKKMYMLWYLYHLMLLTTVVTQTENCCTTVMSHYIYKSCKSCLYSMELLLLPGRHQWKHIFLNFISGPSLIDSIHVYNTMMQKWFTKHSEKCTRVLNLNITWPVCRNDLLRYL